MAVKDRENLVGDKIDASYKLMGTAEERFRMRPRVTGVMTRSVHITLATKFEWQGGHYHKSASEFYRLVRGVVGYVWVNGNGVDRSGTIWGHNVDIRFPPGAAHDIFTSPKSEFLTWQVREGISETPNPEHGGQDWWTVDEAFEEAVKKARKNTEELVRGQMSRQF